MSKTFNIMKTYTTYTNGKKATQANNKKEAAEKLGVKQSQVNISCVHIDYIMNCERI